MADCQAYIPPMAQAKVSKIQSTVLKCRAVVMAEGEGDEPDRTPKREGDHGANANAGKEGRLPALCTTFQKAGNNIPPPCRVLQRQREQPRAIDATSVGKSVENSVIINHI